MTVGARFRPALLLLGLGLIAGVSFAAPPGQADPTPVITATAADPGTAEPTAAVSATAEIPTSTPPAPTALPTEASTPSAVPSPTSEVASGGPPSALPPPAAPLPINEAPLSLAQRASVESAYPGLEVRYTILVTSARADATIDTRSFLPAELDLLAVTTSAGVCSLNPVACEIIPGSSRSALIEIVARVSARAAPGTALVSQTIAQDDLSFTAATERLAIQITAAPDAGVAAQPAPSPSAEAAAPAPQPAPARPRLPEATRALEAPPAERSRRTAAEAPTSQPIATAEPSAAVAAPPAAGADQTALPTAPPPSPTAPLPEATPAPKDLPAQPAETMAATLPETAAAGTLIGIALGLAGMAAVILAARRIRRAALALEQQALVGQVAPFIQALGYLQRRTARQADELKKRMERLGQND